MNLVTLAARRAALFPEATLFSHTLTLRLVLVLDALSLVTAATTQARRCARELSPR